MNAITFSGGDKLKARVREIKERIAAAKAVEVGFPSTDTHTGGVPMGYLASIQEYGATINVAAHEAYIYRKTKKNGEMARKGRFVKKSQANLVTQHEIPEHTITIPSRPFFRTMIAANKGEWGPALGKYLVITDYNTDQALDKLGQGVAGQLQASIRDWSDPPNAPSTIAKKKFNSPLVDTGEMMNSVKSQVVS